MLRFSWLCVEVALFDVVECVSFRTLTSGGRRERSDGVRHCRVCGHVRPRRGFRCRQRDDGAHGRPRGVPRHLSQGPRPRVNLRRRRLPRHSSRSGFSLLLGPTSQRQRWRGHDDQGDKWRCPSDAIAVVSEVRSLQKATRTHPRLSNIQDNCNTRRKPGARPRKRSHAPRASKKTKVKATEGPTQRKITKLSQHLWIPK